MSIYQPGDDVAGDSRTAGDLILRQVLPPTQVEIHEAEATRRLPEVRLVVSRPLTAQELRFLELDEFFAGATTLPPGVDEKCIVYWPVAAQDSRRKSGNLAAAVRMIEKAGAQMAERQREIAADYSKIVGSINSSLQ